MYVILFEKRIFCIQFFIFCKLNINLWKLLFIMWKINCIWKQFPTFIVVKLSASKIEHAQHSWRALRFTDVCAAAAAGTH